jgi:hypothetical protein
MLTDFPQQVLASKVILFGTQIPLLESQLDGYVLKRVAQEHGHRLV